MKNLLQRMVLVAAGLSFMSCSTPSATNEKTPAVVAAPQEKEVAPDVSYCKELTDMAKLVSGMPIDTSSTMYNISQTKEWKVFSARMNDKWARFNEVTNSKITPWVDAEVGKTHERFSTLFYPFSGPDFINAHIFFPGMTNYVFFGLEAPGSIPNPLVVKPNDFSHYFTMHDQSIDHIISLSYFRTLSMKEDLKTKEVDGAGPLLFMQIVRAGKQIIDAKHFRIDSDGSMVWDSTVVNRKGEDVFKTGIVIRFRSENDPQIQTVTYLSIDISDMYLEKPEHDGVNKWLANVESPCAVYLKSASYLLHRTYFKRIRDVILAKADFLLQDDSGVPYRFFDGDTWDISLFGEYHSPVPLFEERYQDDLYKAYRKLSVKPLDFRRGYNNKSNLLIAKKLKK